MKSKIDTLLRIVLRDKRLINLANRMLSNQFLKFCFVGGIATVFNYGFFFMLYQFMHINYLVSSASGYILGVFIGFILNKHFTFESKSRKYTLEITKYFIVYTASLFLGLGFLKLQVYSGIHVLIANVFTIALTTMTNYTGCRFFVFKKEIYAKKINFLLYRYKYLIRYIVIGVGSIFVEVLLISLINRTTSLFNLILHTYLVIVVGFLAGVVFAFILNSKINFPVPKDKNLRTFRVFLIISIFAFFLNLGIMKLIFSQFAFFNYNIMRFVTAAIVFMVSYTLHRRFTFIYIKEVGVAVYLSASENVRAISSKIKFYPDFIHIDMVDKTYNPEAKPVDLSKGRQITKEWPTIKKMTHIMSRHPSKWIKKVHKFSDYIIFHFESDEDIFRLIDLCRKYHRKPGISIFYNTNVDQILRYLDHVDIVQVLGIPKPGYSSQNLEALALDKLAMLNDLKDKHHFEICFDGGVKLTNIKKINAKYIVSGSTVLKSQDAVKAIYDLKTSSRYYLDSHIDLKNYLKKEIKRIIESTDFIKSGTIVGSFAESKGLEGISDMDIIIIIDNLTKDKFNHTISRFKKLEHRIKVDYDHDIIINPTFGPLKFNKKNTAVFHLMIYDVKGHIIHCKKSPFTCLDWQASRDYFKSPMSSIYKVRFLQPNHFFSARRSMKEYLSEFNSNKISYREYKFHGRDVLEVKKYRNMDNKDRFEFSYHIMKFSMKNFLKMLNNENKEYSTEETSEKYFNIFPAKKSLYQKYLFELENMKKSDSFPKWKNKNNQILRSFLGDFESQFNDYFNNSSSKFYFMRHRYTEMNRPGMLFVGQRSDPGIVKIREDFLKKFVDYINSKKISQIYTSPLKRTVQTTEVIKEHTGIGQSIIDHNLIEIDYGAIDGKTYAYLKKKHPKLITEWEKGKDPRFPGGENTQDVLKRVNKFLSKFSTNPGKHSGKNYLVCTHNVFLRCLIGSLCSIPLKEGHKIDIPHMDPVEIILAKNGKFYINMLPEQQNIFFRRVDFRD